MKSGPRELYNLYKLHLVTVAEFSALKQSELSAWNFVDRVGPFGQIRLVTAQHYRLSLSRLIVIVDVM